MSSVSNIVLPTYGADQEDIDRLNEALDALSSNSDIANFMNGDRSMLFQGKVYFDFRDLYTYRGSERVNLVDYTAAVHLDDGMSLWNLGLIPFTAGSQQYSNQQTDIQTGVIIVKPSQVDAMDAGSLFVSGYNSNFSVSLERALLHEFSHLLYHGHDLYSALTKSTTDPSYVNNDFLSYQEAMAIATENFLYVPLAKASLDLGDEQYRMGTGHDRSRFTSGGLSGIEPFESISGPRTIDVSKAGVIEFVSTDSASSTSLTMSFYDRGHKVSVSDTSQAEYDHYIKYVLQSSSPQSRIVTLDNGAIHTNFAAGNVAIASLVSDASPVSFGLGTLLSTATRLSVLNGLPVQNGVPTANAILDILNGVERMVSLSASRFVYESVQQDKIYDITGPVVHEWNEPDADGVMHAYYVSPGIIGIDESSASKGTLILGASGYDDRYVSPTERAVGTINLTTSVDRLIGTNAGDVIISGNGFKSGSLNISMGGSGNDILIGREANDDLQGGIDNDILIGGLGRNHLNGGDGFDIVSYADRTAPMIIDAVQKQALIQGDYNNVDTLSQVEAIIGSAGSNTFYGNGKTVLIGGAGNDTFFLKPGDVVFGGGGQDTYILSNGGTIPSVTERYAIMDLDSNDFVMAPYWTGMGGPSSTSQYTYSIHHDIRAGQPDRISAEVQSYNVTMPQPGTTGTPTWTPAAKWVAYEIYTNDGTVASPFDFSFPGNTDVYGARGQYDFNRIFDLRPAGVTGSALSDRLIMTDASPSGIYDSGGGQDIASYEKKYWGGFYSGVTVSVDSNGIINSYLVDTGAAQHEFRGFAGVQGTGFDDTFEIDSIAGTNGMLDGGGGSDTLSFRFGPSGYTVDIDNKTITHDDAVLTYSGFKTIDVGSGNNLVQSGNALSEATTVIVRQGSHDIDLVDGMHLRLYEYNPGITVTVSATYDPLFDIQAALSPKGISSVFNSTAVSSAYGGVGAHLVFNDSYSGVISPTHAYAGFNRIGNVLFSEFKDISFDSDQIELDLSSMYATYATNPIYGAHVHSKIVGSSSRDTLYGRGAAGDELHGGGGDDLIYASDHSSILFGDAGNDWLYGGAGDDQIHSGTGYDYLMGRGGNDTFFFEGASGGSVSGNKMTTSPEGVDSGFDTVNFDFAFSDVISITSTVYTQTGIPTFDTLATEIQTIHGTFSLFDCDWMTFAGQNGMAITPTYDFHI